MSLRRSLLLGFTFSLLSLISPVSAPMSQRVFSPLSVRAHDRVLRRVDDEERVVLRGDTHPLAVRKNQLGGVPTDSRMERMVLVLKPDDEQQDALGKLLEAQQDTASPYYHQWLTPESYGESFGVSRNDLAQVTGWLQSHGLQVEETMPNRQAIVFGGSAAQVESAFHTPILRYRVGTEVHQANAREPEIPQALVGVVSGVLSLHDFRSQPMHSVVRAIAPESTFGSAHYLAPADFSLIYNVDPLYEQDISGAGQSIAVVGRSNINLADVRQFRNSYGLPPNDPQIVLNGANPGILNADEEAEALLDIEWSGAVAPDANIRFVVSRSTSTSDGVFLSSQYVVNHNLAPVMSVSFGLCEAALGSSGNSFFNSLWKQAAAQGITVFVSSGDSGAAGCDAPSAVRGSKGKGVNGICSSPYSVCVGGTQFDEAANASLYWSSANAPGSLASAFGYIPETAWNESGTWGLWSSGGGASSLYAKPSWQSGLGVPFDGKRDTPDVAFTAAAHDGYMITMHGGLSIVSGTSAASPAWAGLMALAVQSRTSRLGNVNPALYSFAARQQSGGVSVFHDVVIGSNTVPGVSGYSCGPGYDLATGLGSPDANALIANWNDPVAPPTFQLRTTSSGLTVAAGKSATTGVTTTVSNGFNAAITLSASGMPAGMSAKFAPSSINAPGAGQATLTLAASVAVAPGTYGVVISAAGGGVTQRANLSVEVAGFTLTAGSPSNVLAKNASTTVRVASSGVGGFNAPVGLSVAGLPAGVTASFKPASLPSPGSGTSTLTLIRKSGGTAGSPKVTIKAAGGGVTQTVQVVLQLK